jgi:hypothetical protein
LLQNKVKQEEEFPHRDLTGEMKLVVYLGSFRNTSDIPAADCEEEEEDSEDIASCYPESFLTCF